MSKPRLMTQSFINKVLTEKSERVFNIKTIIHSKNFYVFLGILTVCLLLFLMFKYFDKKEKIKEEDIKKKQIEEELKLKEEIEKKNKKDSEYIEQDNDMKVTKIPLKIQQKIHQNENDLNYQENYMNENTYSHNDEQYNNNDENEDNLEYDEKSTQINEYLNQKNYEFENIQEIEYP